MLKLKIYFSIVINCVISSLYFKQLFIPGDEIIFLDTKEILLTPFILIYSFFGFLLYFSIENKFSLFSKNMKPIEYIPSVMFTFIMLAFILLPFSFFEYKNGYKLALPFFIAFFEPIKIKYIFKQDNKILLQKNFILFITSLTLFFVTSLLPKFNAIENSWALYLGGFYFIVLALADYYFHKLQKLT